MSLGVGLGVGMDHTHTSFTLTRKTQRGPAWTRTTDLYIISVAL